MPPAEPHNPWDDSPEPDRVWDLDADPLAREPVEPAAPIERAEVAPTVECWRCGSADVPTRAGKCRKCQARIADEAPDEVDVWQPRPRSRSRAAEVHADTPSLTPVIVLYSVFLLFSVIFGWIILRANARLTEQDIETGTAVMEVLDTILALVGLAIVARAAMPPVSPGTRVAAWALAVPGFLLLIGLNVLYMNLLRDFIRPGLQPPVPPLTALTIVLVCIQPALVEELFFRYVAFGALYRVTGLHSTVWLTGVMFAVAHIYNPLGMPYLFVAGVVFGYARAWGGLALPMVLHFCHNLAVLMIEGA